jgi:hypothetical protein
MNNSVQSTTQNLKLALSREDAAHALGASAITVDRLTKRGLLRPSRATRRTGYPSWEFERFPRDARLSPGENKHALPAMPAPK